MDAGTSANMLKREWIMLELSPIKQLWNLIQCDVHWGPPPNTKCFIIMLAYERQVSCLFHLRVLMTIIIGKTEKECNEWIQKCEKKLKEQNEALKENASEISNVKSEESASKISDSTSKSKLRYDWYQTEAFVVITILLKNMKEEAVKVELTESTLSFSAKLPSSSEYNIELDLAYPIVPERSTHRILPSKVRKTYSLFKSFHLIKYIYLIDSSNVKCDTSKYPSSRPEKKDWDKIVVDIKKEEAEEKLEGEAALNQLFQKIYSEGSDEVKKAMNKSFMESSGTVLSTNWNEVSEKRVEVKPPDGMEWKKWN
ncbi:protein SGT1 homolog [Centruroides sculpturatus]|uniref:protein SGT1 homolog n=1 Tax=Centruroides sculpturatus TaxID=218467 RepID=UPI000C6E4799|nr:protein SGT1 homolog [Centruroides sculpturatus]